MTNRKKVHEVRLKWIHLDAEIAGLHEIGGGAKYRWLDWIAAAGRVEEDRSFFCVCVQPEATGVQLKCQYRELTGTLRDAMIAASKVVAQQLREAGHEVRIEETKK